MFCRVFAISVLFFANYGSTHTCVKPQVDAEAYTTQDATVVDAVAYIATFTVKCANQVSEMELHALVDDRLLPVVSPGGGVGSRQVSWTERLSSASTGQQSISLYDDEGLVAVKKAQRTGASASSVKPLVTVLINHPGVYSGPLVNSEFMAALVAAIVFYIAFSTRSKLLR